MLVSPALRRATECSHRQNRDVHIRCEWRNANTACLRQPSSSRRCSLRSNASAERDGDSEVSEIYPWAQSGWRDAFVSSQPESVQGAIIAGLTLVGALLTYLSYTAWGPWIVSHVPLMDTYMEKVPFIIPPMFVAAGIAHFTEHKGFCNMYPHQGAWGFWYLPGSSSFHVNWTGIAEVLGGSGMVLGALDIDGFPGWLLPASAFGLFLLTAAVTPANMYMWTHNAPGPVPQKGVLDEFPGAVIPWWGHAARALLQIVLMSTFLGVATQHY